MKLFFLMLLVSLSGCGGNDDGDGDGGAPEYVDQNLAGSINAKPWSFVAGRVEKPKAGDTTPRWRFTLISSARENACDDFNIKSENELDVIFSVQNLAVGRTDLSLTEGGQTVTLLDGSLDVPLNIIADRGFLEITAVNAGAVDLEMVAAQDDESSVVGKATVTKCCPLESGFDFEVCKE